LIRALFFDLDGTLLTSARNLSDKTRIALKACRDMGIKVFTATARSPLLSKMLNLTPDEEEILQDGGVFYNGGCICCDNNKIYAFLHEEAVRRSIEIIKQYSDANLAIQMRDEKHSFRFSLSDDEYKQWGVDEVDRIPFENVAYAHVVKIVVFTAWDMLPEMRDKLINAIGTMANVYLTGRDKFRSLEIVDKRVNKKQAIDRLIELCSLNCDEVAVFGDDFNDMEMLKGFKNSIAMGNACDEVKSCAGYITLGNDEEGIYHALRDILKLI
jgi:Cof subfamily protein (haloacid dehalogenase superfamily)